MERLFEIIEEQLHLTGSMILHSQILIFLFLYLKLQLSGSRFLKRIL